MKPGQLAHFPKLEIGNAAVQCHLVATQIKEKLGWVASQPFIFKGLITNTPSYYGVVDSATYKKHCNTGSSIGYTTTTFGTPLTLSDS
jgi:hypothetical protein